VELQVEEDAEAAFCEVFDERRPRGGEKLLADLDAALCGVEASGEAERSIRLGEIERDDDFRISYQRGFPQLS
jgi:hypothetical protein